MEFICGTSTPPTQSALRKHTFQPNYPETVYTSRAVNLQNFWRNDKNWRKDKDVRENK
jgi:hypothetical protein